jgi:hypothetical protein
MLVQPSSKKEFDGTVHHQPTLSNLTKIVITIIMSTIVQLCLLTKRWYHHTPNQLTNYINSPNSDITITMSYQPTLSTHQTVISPLSCHWPNLSAHQTVISPYTKSTNQLYQLTKSWYHHHHVKPINFIYSPNSDITIIMSLTKFVYSPNSDITITPCQLNQHYQLTK